MAKDDTAWTEVAKSAQKVRPVCPPAARNNHIQGTVLLKALIGKDGRITDLGVISGQPLLADAAVAAVKQWKYKPWMINGSPVAIQTTITVNFFLRP